MFCCSKTVSSGNRDSPCNSDARSAKQFVLIRDVSFGEREHHMHSWYLLPRNFVLHRGMSSLESVL